MTWLDGTMITNAKDADDRLFSLYYLLHDRYRLAAQRAALLLQRDYAKDPEFQILLRELRNAVAANDACLFALPSAEKASATAYLKQLIACYDAPSPRVG